MTTGDAILETEENGYCVLERRFSPALIAACRDRFWPVLTRYLDQNRDNPNRGRSRHFLPMPFEPPCFHRRFFLDEEVLAVVRGVMDEGVVADQWGCDVPVAGSEYQRLHVDYERPLFPESPGLELPPYMLVVSFGLVPITRENGPIEIVPGSHRMCREEAIRAAEASELEIRPVLLDIGDVLIRHPWALHRGSPNKTDTPRALTSIRYVRRWYVDNSREVSCIPRVLWASLTPEEQRLMRFQVTP